MRAEVERACGGPVVEAATAPGGFSPGLAARILCGDGRRWFVKAASGQVNPDTPRLHRQEARILGDLDPLIRSGRLQVPRLRATVEHGSWFALILDDIDGRHPALPWEDGQVGQVLGALDRLADVLTPAPITAPTIGQYLGADFTGWRILARTPGDERLDPWSRDRLADLAAVQATWAAHAAGTTLLHADFRADNLLVTGAGVVVVDWPHACRGAAFVDVVLLAPNVAMQGGPQPADLLARSRAGCSASRANLTAIVCALAEVNEMLAAVPGAAGPGRRGSPVACVRLCGTQRANAIASVTLGEVRGAWAWATERAPAWRGLFACGNTAASQGWRYGIL